MTIASSTKADSVPLGRDKAGGLFGQTMGLVALTAAVFALGAYVGRDTSGLTGIVCFLLAFGVLLAMNAAARPSPGQRSRMSPESIGGNVPRDYERSARPDSTLVGGLECLDLWPNGSLRCAS